MSKVLLPVHGSWMLLLAAVVFMAVGILAGETGIFFLIIFLTQTIGILMPPVLFLTLSKYKLKETLRLKVFNFKQLVIITVGIIAVYPVGVFFNAVVQYILVGLDVPLPESPLPPVLMETPFLISLLFIAVLPGICEEVLFRGFIMRSYEKIGRTAAITISAILFGMFHFNLLNLLGPMVLGGVIGYIVIATNSLVAGMYAHALNNTIALTLMHVIPSEAAEYDQVVNQELMLIALYILAIVAIICGAISFLILRLLAKNTPNNEYNFSNYKESSRFMMILPVIIFVILFILLA
ncbi:type II CAAX endopeptidase family protein [Proteinivorax tanatarense]|uniref:Type II CAAX endopeptidase family protein n=1 Tax=Proteinivorax tanatarense TaxID=1260629 RepID=A0AAU7VJ01_9FIRM